jgi:hypothetical protein
MKGSAFMVFTIFKFYTKFMLEGSLSVFGVLLMHV